MTKIATWITDCLKVKPGTVAQYESMSEYHYCTGKVNPHAGIFVISPTKEAKDYFPDPLAVLCFKMPIPILRARNTLYDRFFTKPLTQSQKLSRVNKNIIYISRIVVDPRFHRIGLGTKLLSTILDTIKRPIVETLTPIDKYNAFWKHNGFIQISTSTPEKYLKIHRMIESIGLIPDHNLTVSTLANRIVKLEPKKRNLLSEVFIKFIHQYRHHNEHVLNIDVLRFILEKMFYPNAYFHWKNPNVPLRHDY